MSHPHPDPGGDDRTGRPRPGAAFGLVLALALLPAVPGGGAARAQNLLDTPLPPWAVDAAAQMCTALRDPDTATLQQLSSLIDLRVVEASVERTSDTIFRARFTTDDGLGLTVTSIEHGTDGQRTVLVGSAPIGDRGGEPVFRIVVRPSCEVASASALALAQDGSPRSIVRFTGADMRLDGVEKLNPIVPDGVDPGGIRVAHVDTGVAYDRPEIAARLARDEAGEILGYDFRDEDMRPYDRDPLQPTLFARQRGTAVASVLLREAEDAALVPFRFDVSPPNLARLPGEAAARGARVMMLPTNVGQASDWEGFVAAMAAHPDILFIASAGTQGRDIDSDPIYPASLRVPNLISVTSVEPDGHFSRRGNWGARTVDVAVPAERVPILLPSGDEGLGSGAEYAVARVAAMAVRLLADEPGLTGEALRLRIIEEAEPLPGMAEAMTAHGWIEDPTG